MDDSFNLTTSLLDRLLDDDPKQNSEPAQHRVISKRQIIDSVVRDVENLLNTRCSPVELPASFTRLKGSVMKYGLRDMTGENPESTLARQQVCMEIEKAIAVFEPRLKKTVVRIETQTSRKRQLFFRITGVLIVEPLAEPVSFDTFFDTNKGQYIISR